MRTRPLLAAIAAMSVAGCTLPRSDDGHPFIQTAACMKKDSAADCWIEVDVSVNDDETRCGVQVLASQSTVGFKSGAKDKWVEWKLTRGSASGARFANNGIAPKAVPAGNIDRWKANFSNGGASHSGRQFKWKNGNEAPQAGTDYEYMVNAEVHTAGGRTLSCSQDPVIRNQR